MSCQHATMVGCFACIIFTLKKFFLLPIFENTEISYKNLGYYCCFVFVCLFSEKRESSWNIRWPFTHRIIGWSCPLRWTISFLLGLVQSLQAFGLQLLIQSLELLDSQQLIQESSLFTLSQQVCSVSSRKNHFHLSSVFLLEGERNGNVFKNLFQSMIDYP